MSSRRRRFFIEDMIGALEAYLWYRKPDSLTR